MLFAATHNHCDTHLSVLTHSPKHASCRGKADVQGQIWEDDWEDDK